MPQTTGFSETTLVHVCEIAQGGMGQVALVVRRQDSFQRAYAVKRLHPHFRGDEQVRAMFVKEAQVAGRIHHPNVISVLEVGTDQDGPFMIMDYVDGVSLSMLLKRFVVEKKLLPVQTCVRIAMQVAKGLHAAHELLDDEGQSMGVIHRDVTPQNILLGFDGGVKLTDFGIVKALGQDRTTTGILKGKLGYHSPEQLRFEEPDRRSDIFQLGVVLYEALAAKRLYKNDTTSAVAKQILKDPPPDIGERRDDIPPELVELLFRMLAKNPDHRPTTALEVAQHLETILLDVAIVEGPTDLGSFIGSRFTELRSERRALIARALDQSKSSPGVEPPGRRPPRSLLIFAALLLALAGGIASWIAIDRQEDAVREVLPQPQKALSPPERIAAPAVGSDASVEVTPVVAKKVKSSTRKSTRRRRPRRKGRRARPPRRSTKSKVKGNKPQIPIWNW